MELKMYQVDAFTGKLFSGNPAAVVVLESSIEDSLMQSIASENIFQKRPSSQLMIIQYS